MDGYFVTVTFNDPQTISTVVLLGEASGSVYLELIYGPNQVWSSSENTKMPDTGFKTVKYLTNSANVKYITWKGDDEWRAGEIMCFKNKYITREELDLTDNPELVPSLNGQLGWTTVVVNSNQN